MSLKPLVVICGTTGVGKSKLAIEIALKLRKGSQYHGWRGARIINADSMQIYEGLNVITNKVTEQEMGGIDHLLMSFKKPGEQYVVGQWVHDAMNAIEETHRRNEIPIVVGGTSYWIQNLMFPNRLVSENDNKSTIPIISPDVQKSLASLPKELLDIFNSLPASPPSASTDANAAFSLYTILSMMDPKIATRWHWRDTRKVLRSLKIIKDTGQIPSEILSQQSETSVRPRYRTLCFWLYAMPSILNPRLDERVDGMIKNGLLDEIMSLRAITTSSESEDNSSSVENGDPTDYSLGIYQSIGYKEFHQYLTSAHPDEKLFNAAVEDMKHSTRKYAKRQVSWIRNKLLPAINAVNATGNVAPTYLLDATKLGDDWDVNVRNAATQITDAFLEHGSLPDPLTLSEISHEMLMINSKPTKPNETLSARRKLVCPCCTVNEEQPVMIEQGQEWEMHRKTRFHRRMSQRAERVDGRRHNLKDSGDSTSAVALDELSDFGTELFNS